jgi:DegV family protein with EDD domain
MVRIVTDSAADFSPAELEQKNICCIPLKVLFGGEEYEENINLSKDQFYEKLLAFEGFPKTSQAAPAVLAGLFEEAKAEGDEIIYFTLSSALSGTWQSAMFIKEDMGYDKAFVVDSRNATGGQRMLVEHAVRLRDQGKCAADIVAEVEALRERIVLYACINTLEYLYRGGRISHLSYALGTLAQIKPIIHVDHMGRVDIPAKAMGMRKGMEHLCKQADAKTPDPEYPLYVMYTNDRSVAETLAVRLAEHGQAVHPDNIIQVGAAIGSHIGPAACGLVYVGK